MNVAVLLYNDAADLDALGVYSILGAAKPFLDEGAFSLYTVARSRMSVVTAGGLIVTPHWAFMSAPPPDVLVVPGGNLEAVTKDRAVMAYLREHAPRARRCLAVGTGAFLLGELGLVRDLDATTWAGATDKLRDYEPGRVVEAPLVKNDNGRWFAGGGAQGLAAALELLRELFGEAVAARVRERLELERLG